MSDDHLIPNTTQVPNTIIDLLMPFLNDGEARVLLYLCRRIYGFQRDSDSVSLPQFVNGIRTEDRQLDFGAGISRQGAMNALAVLKAIGIVEQTEGGRGRGNIPVFRINRKCEMVKWLDLISQEAGNVREKIVQRLDLIRKKSLPYGPFHKKAANSKDSEEKVKNVDLLEKVQTTNEKGLTVRPTKPSSTKPRNTEEGGIPLLPDSSPKKPKRVPKSQQPGELHPNTVEAVQNMMVDRFHCLAEPTKDNEIFWDAQIAYILEANAISFTTCLKKVDAYWSSNRDKVAMKPPGLRKQMRRGIEIEVEKAQRAMKGNRRYG